MMLTFTGSFSSEIISFASIEKNSDHLSYVLTSSDQQDNHLGDSHCFVHCHCFTLATSSLAFTHQGTFHKVADKQTLAKLEPEDFFEPPRA